MGSSVVVGVDGSPAALAALAWAAAEAVGADDALTVVHGWELPSHGLRAPVSDHQYAAAADTLVDQAVAEVASDRPELVVKGESRRQAPAQALVEASEGADLLVVGSRGRGGFTGLLLGSVSQQCLHHARCPVAVVRSPSQERWGRIVVGVDGSEHAWRALSWAAGEASRRKATLHAIYAWQYPPVGAFVMGPAGGYEGLVDRIAEAARAAVRRQHPDVRLEVEGSFGPAVTRLLEASERADLLVVGSRGHGGFRDLLVGSVSLECSHHASCPVVVVRAPA